MVFNFVTYVKNRKIGSTYPSIDAKPESSTKRFLKKFRASLARKCAAVVNAMPFIRPRPSPDLSNSFELQGMCYLVQPTNFPSNCIFEFNSFLQSSFHSIRLIIGSVYFLFNFPIIQKFQEIFKIVTNPAFIYYYH